MRPFSGRASERGLFMALARRGRCRTCRHSPVPPNGGRIAKTLPVPRQDGEYVWTALQQQDIEAVVPVRRDLRIGDKIIQVR